MLQFEIASKANNWNAERKTMTLVVTQRGPALDLLRTVPETEKNDYHKHYAALTLHLGEEHLQQLKRRWQKVAVTLQDFEAEED